MQFLAAAIHSWIWHSKMTTRMTTKMPFWWGSSSSSQPKTRLQKPTTRHSTQNATDCRQEATKAAYARVKYSNRSKTRPHSYINNRQLLENRRHRWTVVAWAQSPALEVSEALHAIRQLIRSRILIICLPLSTNFRTKMTTRSVQMIFKINLQLKHFSKITTSGIKMRRAATQKTSASLRTNLCQSCDHRPRFKICRILGAARIKTPPIQKWPQKRSNLCFSQKISISMTNNSQFKMVKIWTQQHSICCKIKSISQRTLFGFHLEKESQSMAKSQKSEITTKYTIR